MLKCDIEIDFAVYVRACKKHINMKTTRIDQVQHRGREVGRRQKRSSQCARRSIPSGPMLGKNINLSAAHERLICIKAAF